MTERSIDRLELLYRISQTFNSSLDLDEVLNCVMDEVITATHAERGFLMLLEQDGSLCFSVARGMDRQAIDRPEFQVSRGVVERVAFEGEPLLTVDAQSDEWLGGRASVSTLGLRSLLCVPLQFKETLMGAIYVDNRMQTGAFSPDDLDLLMAIASSAAIAIENARLYQVAVAQGRLERELQVAREVQEHFIRQHIPQLAGWEFAAYWRPAREVSGDFYDFVPIGQEHIGAIIADVSDKGMPAALFMTLTRSIVRASVAPALRPEDSIAHANRLICEDAAYGMFVSLCYMQLANTGGVTYVNAGHNPPLLLRAGDGLFRELKRTGIVLGIDPRLGYEQKYLELDPGDLIVMYTDGVSETLNSDEEEFGIERLKQCILEYADAPASQLVCHIQKSISHFSESTALSDDITMVVIRRI
jgi:serine phosphatase RsbU (regulator of sigma subunit)